MIHNLAFKFTDQKELLILDQTLLPEKKEFIQITNPKDMLVAIQTLKVRGANLIGITAGFCLAQYAFKNPKTKDFDKWAKALCQARPTALHLSKAVNLIKRAKTAEEKLNQALNFYEKDKKDCEQMAHIALKLINKKDSLLTYCNTGALATSSAGTALGVIKKAFQKFKNLHVFVAETRPLYQGARLTCWELNEHKIPCTLICDNMLADMMSKHKIQKVFVGADCIALNGDTANKIGTYNLAVICRHFDIPFYVVAPTSAINTKLKTGKEIPIEQRDPKEVSPYWAFQNGVSVKNPAFDITNKELITGIITEKNIWKP